MFNPVGGKLVKGPTTQIHAGDVAKRTRTLIDIANNTVVPRQDGTTIRLTDLLGTKLGMGGPKGKQTPMWTEAFELAAMSPMGANWETPLGKSIMEFAIRGYGVAADRNQIDKLGHAASTFFYAGNIAQEQASRGVKIDPQWRDFLGYAAFTHDIGYGNELVWRMHPRTGSHDFIANFNALAKSKGVSLSQTDLEKIGTVIQLHGMTFPWDQLDPRLPGSHYIDVKLVRDLVKGKEDKLIAAIRGENVDYLKGGKSRMAWLQDPKEIANLIDIGWLMHLADKQVGAARPPDMKALLDRDVIELGPTGQQRLGVEVPISNTKELDVIYKQVVAEREAWAKAHPNPAKSVAVAVPAAKASAEKPFIGDYAMSLLRKVPQLGTGEIKEVNFKVKVGEGKWDNFGIFFEAEAKLSPPKVGGQVDSATVDAVRTALRESPTKGLSVLLPEGKGDEFAAFTSRLDKPHNPNGTKFGDNYWDDANGTLYANRSGVRERYIDGSKSGKFESKIYAGNVQDSAVMSRLEAAVSINETRTSQKLIDDAITFFADPANMAKAKQQLQDNPSDPTNPLNNPMVILKLTIPAVDLKTLAVRQNNAANREQYVFSKPGADGKPQDYFLATLDHGQAQRVGGTKVGKFVEIEVERMDGKIDRASQEELIRFTKLLSDKFGLQKSPGTKYQQGFDASAP